MPAKISAAIYFGPEHIRACARLPETGLEEKIFAYEDAVIEEVFSWVQQYPVKRTHICLIENESVDLFADDLADTGFHVYQVNIHTLLNWLATAPPQAPDGTTERLMLRYLETQRPPQYESRTPQTDALLEMFDYLDMLDTALEQDDPTLLPEDVQERMERKSLDMEEVIDDYRQAQVQAIREHLMTFPELMTPEILEEFFPELIESFQHQRH